MAALRGAKRTQAKATKKLASKRTTGGQGNKVQVVVIGDVYWDSVAIHQKPGCSGATAPPELGSFNGSFVAARIISSKSLDIPIRMATPQLR